ncbi:hypothetical protein DF039_09100 [Burkholderia cenocepacia]|nr:hypothetical protein DF039_09100 [Burkholderia cenocepacia]
MQLKIAPVKAFFRMRDELGGREQNLWQQMRALIAREVESKVRASLGSHSSGSTPFRRAVPIRRYAIRRGAPATAAVCRALAHRRRARGRAA